MIDQHGADQRTLRGRAFDLSWQPTDGDGIPAEPAGDVAVTVTNVLGEEIETGAIAIAGSATAARTASVAADQIPDVDLLTAVWTDDDVEVARTTVEVVGGFLFSLAEFRDTELSASDAQAEKYTNAKVVEVRKEVEQFFESRCGQSFVPTIRVQRRDGTLGYSMVLDRPNVRAVRRIRSWTGIETYTDLTDVDSLAASPSGVLTGRVWFPGYELEIVYEHGMDAAPRDVKRAAMRYARVLLNRPTSALPDRATSMQTEFGSYTLATPGTRDWMTGIPEIDEVLMAHSFATVGIA